MDRNRKEKGIVYLVGAGPGDPKLITIRGMECLRKSDVVVYDRLASPRLLRDLKPGAEKIYVGKLPDRHTMKQEEINQLLVDLALQGKTVTRLKGGDPTIFGRVGEEAGLLYDHGIEFEIVPGITSAISVPAYAGISVTHRELASSISIITGHESPDKLDDSIHWDKVTNATGTLVFLMGVAKIGYIAEQLINHGRPPSTPVALVRWGTCVEQETVVGTLETIEGIVKAANFKPPAVIVVGEVVTQREKLRWAERRPLFGTRVLVTRARAQSSELSERIEELGGEACEFPVIAVREPVEAAAVQQVAAALQEAESYDWLLFTSVNGVHYFFNWLKRLKIDIRRYSKARIAAVGPATAAALEAYGLIVDNIPAQFQAEGMIDSLAKRIESGQRVLLARGDLGRDVLPRELEARGAAVVEAAVYETVIAEEQDDAVLELLREGRVHMVTFTSSSTVSNLITILKRSGIQNPAQLLSGSTIACIGPLTAKTAEQAGLAVDIQPQDATIEALTQAMAAYRLEQRLKQEEAL